MIIGLTGGIASGKSSVAREFERLGAVVVDADRIGHEVIAAGRPAWRELQRAFGNGILAPGSREIDRRALGAMVFADPAARRRLNAIVHPRLIRELERRVSTALRAGRVVVIDAALLVELGWGDRVDAIVVVDAPRRVRLQRLVRAGFTRAAALDRMRAQAGRRERLAAADHVIRNGGTRAALAREARRVWKELRKEGAEGPA